MSEMTCPICCKKFNELEYGLLKNGNPVCPECANAEKDGKQEEKN